MKIFVSFRFSGEDFSVLDRNLSQICACLREQGHECFCTLWDEEKFQKEKFTHKQIMDYGLKELDSSDAVLAFVNSSEKSEGMLLEIGYAMAKGKDIYLAIKDGCQSRFVEAAAKETVRFEDLDDLCKKMKI